MTRFYVAPSGGVRDPDMIYLHGYFWICYTAGNFGAVQYFSIAKSADLKTWTHVTDVSTASAGFSNTWAPNWFLDPNDGSLHIVVALGSSTFQLYRLDASSTDPSMATWTNPVAISGANFLSNMIDSDLDVPDFDPTAYYLWFKDETGKYILYATSSNLTGTYTVQNSGDWAGWRAALPGDYIEAPDVQKFGANQRCYFDVYTTGGAIVGMHYSDASGDTFNTPWTSPLALTGGFKSRHGAIMANPLVQSGVQTVTDIPYHIIHANGLRALKVLIKAQHPTVKIPGLRGSVGYFK